jgi:hypothetical protein
MTCGRVVNSHTFFCPSAGPSGSQVVIVVFEDGCSKCKYIEVYGPWKGDKNAECCRQYGCSSNSHHRD